jgi:hypothetical protein
MAPGIARVPFLTVSLAQLDWTHCAVLPSSVQGHGRRHAQTPNPENLARYLTPEFAGQVRGMQFGLMSTERPACRMSTRIKSPIRPVRDLSGDWQTS